MLGRVKGEGRDQVRVRRVAHKASSSMGVETEHKEESQVMRIPKCFETLAADLVMCSRIHKHNNEEHEMTSDTTRLVIMDLDHGLGPNLCIDYEQRPKRVRLRTRTSPFYVNEVNVVSSRVNLSQES